MPLATTAASTQNPQAVRAAGSPAVPCPTGASLNEAASDIAIAPVGGAQSAARATFVQIPIRRQGAIVAHALIDAEFSWLCRWAWDLNAKGYPTRSSSTGRILMHCVILGASHGDGRIVDHVNGDKLDNRIANLRFVTRSQNQQNRRGPTRASRSGHLNVGFDFRCGKWRARFVHQGKNVSLGCFDSAESASHAVRAKRRELGLLDEAMRHGSFLPNSIATRRVASARAITTHGATHERHE